MTTGAPTTPAAAPGGPGSGDDVVRRVRVHAVDDVVLETAPRPVPATGEVLLRPVLVGICGSDLHAARGLHPFVPLPYLPGHEVVGVVEEAGPDVDPAWVGRRVVVEPNLACGRCVPCAEGRYNICEELAVLGCQTPGGLTDALALPVHRLHPLPPGLPDEVAVLAEPLSTPLRALRRAGDVAGRRVAVLGAGPIGLLVALAASRAGAAAVVVGDVLASKRERAVRLGATGAVDATAPDAVAQARAVLGGPADVVVDCVSREGSVRQGVEMLRKGGALVVVGVAAGPTTVPLDLVQDREIDVLGTLMFVGQDVRAAVEMLAEGAVPADEVVTATYDITEAGAAFAAAADPETLKVVVRVSPSLPAGMAGTADDGGPGGSS